MWANVLLSLPAIPFPLVFFLSRIFGVMPYRRRAYKRPSYGGRDKYSIQNKAFSFTIASGTSTSFLVVPATAVEGMRKIKHLTVNLTTGADAIQLYWALVYVPQGTPVGQISIGTSANVEMYEPNQFVMNCGVVDPNAGPIRFSSPISRNLNNGDAIYLVLLGTHEAGTVGVRGTCRYAVTLQ